MKELLEKMREVNEQRYNAAKEVAEMLTELIDSAVKDLGVKIHIGDYDYDIEDSCFEVDYTMNEELVIVTRM